MKAFIPRPWSHNLVPMDTSCFHKCRLYSWPGSNSATSRGNTCQKDNYMPLPPQNKKLRMFWIFNLLWAAWAAWTLALVRKGDSTKGWVHGTTETTASLFVAFYAHSHTRTHACWVEKIKVLHRRSWHAELTDGRAGTDMTTEFEIDLELEDLKVQTIWKVVYCKSKEQALNRGPSKEQKWMRRPDQEAFQCRNGTLWEPNCVTIKNMTPPRNVSKLSRSYLYTTRDSYPTSPDVIDMLWWH